MRCVIGVLLLSVSVALADGPATRELSPVELGQRGLTGSPLQPVASDKMIAAYIAAVRGQRHGRQL